jgi:hypothetical protein
MQTHEIKDERPRFAENDPPQDLSRENAAFERERARLVRDHLGQLALIHGDEVVGAFANYDDAVTAGFQRFGLVRLVIRPITEKDEPEFAPYLDINHPSVRRID